MKKRSAPIKNMILLVEGEEDTTDVSQQSVSDILGPRHALSLNVTGHHDLCQPSVELEWVAVAPSSRPTLSGPNIVIEKNRSHCPHWGIPPRYR